MNWQYNQFCQSIYNQNSKITTKMPKLKKYSDLYGNDSNSVSNIAEVHGDTEHRRTSTGQKQQSSSAQQSKQHDEISGEESQLSKPLESLTGQKNQVKKGEIKSSNRVSKPKQRQSTSEDIAPKPKTQRKSKLQSKYDADEIMKKIQQQCAQQQQIEKKNDPDDENQTSIGIGIPENVFQQKKKTKNKRSKYAIKAKSKFFDIQINLDECQESNGVKRLSQVQKQQLRKLQQEHANIIALKDQKNHALMDQRKAQLQQRVNRIRQRMDFKNAHSDARFKQHFKQTLQNVKDCQQVQLQIQAPKIFKGTSAKQTDAALYIKNLSHNPSYQSQSAEQNTNKSTREHKILAQKPQHNQNKRKIDRRQFYSQFAKQIKQSKAMQLPSQMDALFKKSSLEQIQSQFQKNQYLFKQQTNKSARNSLSNSMAQRSNSNVSKMRKSIQMQRQNSSKEKQNQLVKLNKNSLNQVQRPSLNGKIDQIKEIKQENEKSNQESKQDNIEKPNEKGISKDNSNKQYDKKTKQRSKSANKKRREKDKKAKQQKDPYYHKKMPNRIRQLFLEQAEDESNGYGDNCGQSSNQQSDNSSIESLIDRKQVKFIKKNQRQAHKKFQQKEIERDNEIIKRIKQKIMKPMKIKCEETSESRRRRVRIQQAKKKFSQEDKFEGENIKDLRDQKQKQSSNSTSQNFSQKLKNLQEEICSKPQKQNSRLHASGIGLKKSQVSWKQLKIITKIQNPAPIQAKKQEKRGGFITSQNSKAVAGSRINAPNKSKSKPKIINF